MTRSALRLAAAAALLPTLGACDWFTDFKNQPKIEPWEPVSQLDSDTTHAPRPNPQNSVPVSGTFLAAYQVSYNPIPGVIDSIANAVTNPTPVSPASLMNGRKNFQVNCAVCHGDLAQGNGPATLYGMPGISLVNERVRGFKDGYIYGMMRNGRGLMPTYNRIEEMDRWDVVNYVRALQGLVPNTAGTGPVGYPGQNGATVPGYSATAPSLPAPMWREPRGAASGMNVADRFNGGAGEVRSPAMALGELGRPVPAGVNDSGPAARRNAATAPVRPVPQAPAAQEAVPSLTHSTPGTAVPSNGRPTGAVRGIQTTPGGRP
ncbi:MAG TPA: c-type cytochrome [Gemmatirosa sp.]